MGFPLGPAPSGYANVVPSARCGIYYSGDVPSFTLSTAGATGYVVRDYYGTIVSSGPVSGTSVTPAIPGAGWPLGWYRLYLTGPTLDASFGFSLGSFNFCIVRRNANFPTNPAPAVGNPTNNGVSIDQVTRGVMGMGPQRYAANASSTAASIADLTAGAAVDATYYTGYAGPGRPRPLIASFPSTTTPSNLSGVTTVVAAAYPLGITRFEGPYNEPPWSQVATTVTQMQAFYAAVKAGNPNAIVVGPQPVTINVADQASVATFLAGAAAYVDEFSFHFYNGCLGDLNLGRAVLDAFKATLTAASFTKPLWQTEQGTMVSVAGVYHPRRARWQMLQIMLLEQYGVPLERNHVWYDISHGFWAYPAFWQNSDGSLNPQAPLIRVYAEETYGKPWASRLSFGTWGDRIFLGSVYTGGDGTGVAVIAATSEMPGATVTLSVTGASGPLAVSDAWGKTSTVAVTSGRVTVPVSGLPTYVRLPAGASVSVYTCNDWPSGTNRQSSGVVSNVAAGAAVRPLQAVDGSWVTVYDAKDIELSKGSGSLPDTYTVTWPTGVRLDRVLIWCGSAWQSQSTLVDFDVQTSSDGATWTTRATVTKTDCVSFMHGSSANGPGCAMETYWDEQWVFDVKLPAPVTAKAVRLYVRAISYGGEPDAAAVAVGGQGDASPRLSLQQVVVLCDDNLSPQYVEQ